jgi:hypothetical protein
MRGILFNSEIVMGYVKHTVRVLLRVQTMLRVRICIHHTLRYVSGAVYT